MSEQLIEAPEDIYDTRNPQGPVVLVARKGETIRRDILTKYGYAAPAVKKPSAKKVAAADVEDKAVRHAPRRSK